jgi:nucleoid-associated protein YgaU
VQPNDNYWTVSEKVYGTGGYFKAIYEHNRRQHAQSDRLQVGDALDVPEVAVLQQMYPDLCPKLGGAAGSPPATSSAAAAAPTPSGTRFYTVADGDTLYEIARRQLGQPSRWGEIYQLNHDQLGNDFGYLHPGTQLLIPSDASGTAVAHEPTGTLQR